MIIWAGWGILAVLLPALGAAVMAGIASAMGLDSSGVQAMVGLGIALGGVGGWFAGKWFNQDRVADQARKLLGGRRQQLEHLVQTGQFHLGPGFPPPNSYQEASAQADQLFESEVGAAEQQLRNRHTVFWIPMQYVSILIAIGGLVIGVMGLVQ